MTIFFSSKLVQTSAVLLALVVGLVVGAVGPGWVTGNTTVHDPTMCRDNAGKYWLFSTGPGLEIRTSTDRIDFKFVGRVWPNGASWTDVYTGGANKDLWAPDCVYRDGEFVLYYSASSFGSQNSGIFLAKSKTGEPGSWTNHGLITSTSPSLDYNAIDPNLYIENNDWYLSLGSFWTGIKLLKVDPSTGKPTSGVSGLARRPNNGGAIEASILYKYGNYYYLFTSWDKCCAGTSSTYNIRVGRSSSPTGPYTDKSGVQLMNGGGTLVLSTSGNVIGPGGQDVFTDVDGPILVYHYYTASGPLLGINRLDFSSGWPIVV